ncbi:MAG TPA: hemolysin family protein [Planctomycetota bacterium]|nr:hemolysin family protein [Planctomycetota bacterium]
MSPVAGYDLYWILVAGALLVVAVYVATCRQALAVFSRKILLEKLPEARREEFERLLDEEDELIASLRGLDLLLRLGLVLSLAFGRFMARPGLWPHISFLEALAECVILAGHTVLLFVVTLEVLPGILARVRPEAMMIRRLKLISLVHRVFAPIRVVTTGFVRWAVTVLGGGVARPSADILEEEILTAAEEGERGGLLGSRDIDMIESIITFGNVEVSQVMTPRTEMVCLDIEDPLSVNVARAVECGHSRIPVFRDSKDNIVGILYVKDLLRFWERKDSIEQGDILRKPHFVPLSKKIGELFQEFKTQRFHIAIVLDEFGGTSGLITIEDIIEEIVGEITDEHEKVERPLLRRLSPGVVEVDASLHIDDLNDQLDLGIPEGDLYDTIGGFLAAQMGKIPSVGEVFELDSLRFEIAAADERRIRRLRIRFPSSDGGAATAAADTVETKK